MLVESSFSSPIDTSLLNVSEFQNPFSEYDWASLAETYQMIHKIPENCQVSFLEATPVPNAMNLDEPKLQVSSPVTHKVSEKDLTSLVYNRRKKSVKPSVTTELSSGKDKKQDDSLDESIVLGESTKMKNRFNNCLFYSRRKRKSGETTSKGDGFDDDGFVSEHDCGETKRRSNRLDNCLVYSRKKCRVTFNCGSSFTECDSGGTKLRGDQAECSSYSLRSQIVKADGGEIKNSGDQSKQLVKSNGSHIGESKRNGDRSNALLWYSRRKKQKGKSIVTTTDRVNGFLVYRRKKYATSISRKHVDDDTKKNDSCSSLKSSSELASGSTDCDSSDDRMSETDTECSSSRFRQCKHCDKPGTVGKMLFCGKCKEAYHTSCCGVRMKKVAEINDWLCPSCWKKKSSKIKIEGKTSRTRKLRVKPCVIGIRVGKEFQADVPDWSSPIMSDASFVGETLEIDPSEYMHDLKKAKKPCSAVNWLQCRQENSNGDICRKWRRAPRSEVQTRDWECFCSVLWDPAHADCAVPQELETSEIMKQLKYIKMLRPRPESQKEKQIKEQETCLAALVS